MKILIADDHDLLRDTLTMFLQGEGGIETVTAADLEDALGAIDTNSPFDLIILDYSMPGMSGLNGLKVALSHSGGQRVALMSGIATRSIAEEALASGAAGDRILVSNERSGRRLEGIVGGDGTVKIR